MRLRARVEASPPGDATAAGLWGQHASGDTAWTWAPRTVAGTHCPCSAVPREKGGLPGEWDTEGEEGEARGRLLGQEGAQHRPPGQRGRAGSEGGEPCWGFRVGSADERPGGAWVKRARDSPAVEAGAQGIGNRETVSLEMASGAMGMDATHWAKHRKGTEQSHELVPVRSVTCLAPVPLLSVVLDCHILSVLNPKQSPALSSLFIPMTSALPAVPLSPLEISNSLLGFGPCT